MRFNGLKSHLRLQKLRFLDAPGLFLLEIVLTGAYDLADVLANVLVLKWMIGALMGRDLIRAAWVLGGFLVYQLSVSFLWHWYFERVYPQWKERLEYKLNRRLYRIMLDADCRKYNDEAYFHGYRRALQFTQTKMEETLEFYRQLFGSFLAGAVAVVIYIRMDQMIVVFVLLAFVASRFCVKSLVEKTNAKRDEQNKKDALHQNYLRIFLRKEYAAEGRILGCLPFFVKRDQDSFSQKAEQTKQWNRRIFPIAFGREIGSDFLFIDCLMIAYLGYCFFWKKTIGLDDFAALLNGTHIILYALSVLFEQMAGRAGEYAGYIDGFFDFCEQNGEVSNDKNQESMAADSRMISEISMEHVDFGYGEKKVLLDICFQMKRGKRSHWSETAAPEKRRSSRFCSDLEKRTVGRFWRMEQPFRRRKNGRNVGSISRFCLPEICCMRRLWRRMWRFPKTQIRAGLRTRCARAVCTEKGLLFRSKNRCCGNFARTVSCFQRDRNRRLRWRAPAIITRSF